MMWWALGAVIYILLMATVLLFFKGATALEAPPVPDGPDLPTVPECEPDQPRDLAAVLN